MGDGGKAQRLEDTGASIRGHNDAVVVRRTGIGTCSTLDETAALATEETLWILATVCIQCAAIGTYTRDLDTEVPAAFSVDGVRATAVLIPLTRVLSSTRDGDAAILDAGKVGVTLAIPVIGALGVPWSCFFRTAMPEADCMGYPAVLICGTEIASWTIGLPTGPHEALEVRLSCTITLRTTLISSGTSHDAAGSCHCIANKVGGDGAPT